MHSWDSQIRWSLATGTVLTVLLCGCGPEPVATGTGASSSGGDASSSGPGPTPTDGGPADTTTGPTSTSSPVDTTADATATGGTTLVSDGCVGPVVDNPKCRGTAPYCVEEGCVGCKSLNCAELDPSKPVCSDVGVCVECLANEDCPAPEEPACDVPNAVCVACTLHAQCPDTACNLETGQCFPAENVLWVDHRPGPQDPCSDVEPGFGADPATPFCTLQRAFDELVEAVPTTIRIKDGVLPQELPSALGPGDFVVAIVGDGPVTPSLLGGASAEPRLSFSAGNLAFVDRLALRDEPAPMTDPAIACTGATVWLDHVRITATATAMRATDCRVHVRRSVVTATQNGGIEMTGDAEGSSQLWLENSFITENLGNGFGPIRLWKFAGAELRYATLAFNKDAYPTIECKDAAGVVAVRNSVIAELPPHIGGDCEAEVFAGLQVETGEPATLAQHFASFTDGIYRARSGGPLAGTAQWGDGDPSGDFDGDPRPPEPPTPEYAGADQPR